MNHNDAAKLLAERFLGWKLPENFNPDGGVSFKPNASPHGVTGTNLLDFTQAYGMFTTLLDGVSIEGEPKLTFGDALEFLKDGKRVARQGWNGKHMWIALSGPIEGREIAFENFWSRPCSEFAQNNGGSATVLPCINMKTADGKILMGWLASQTDMLSDDWVILD